MDGTQNKIHPFCDFNPQLLHQSGKAHINANQVVSVASTSSGYLEIPDVAGCAPATVPPRVLVINHRPTILYRKIRPSDLVVLKEIHEALFPIKYEADFYMNAVHGRGIISWAAVDTSRSDPYCDELIGFVTSRVISPSVGEELDMLGYEISKSERSLIYILTLGVIPPYRNSGIGIINLAPFIKVAVVQFYSW